VGLARRVVKGQVHEGEEGVESHLHEGLDAGVCISFVDELVEIGQLDDPFEDVFGREGCLGLCIVPCEVADQEGTKPCEPQLTLGLVDSFPQYINQFEVLHKVILIAFVGIHRIHKQV
jgi:hypothetical protein